MGTYREVIFDSKYYSMLDGIRSGESFLPNEVVAAHGVIAFSWGSSLLEVNSLKKNPARKRRKLKPSLAITPSSVLGASQIASSVPSLQNLADHLQNEPAASVGRLKQEYLPPCMQRIWQPHVY